MLPRLRTKSKRTAIFVAPAWLSRICTVRLLDFPSTTQPSLSQWSGRPEEDKLKLSLKTGWLSPSPTARATPSRFGFGMRDNRAKAAQVLQRHRNRNRDDWKRVFAREENERRTTA